MAAKKTPADEIKTFSCSLCRFKMDYHYYGNKPPFTKALTLLEQCYVLKDPFSKTGGLIMLGGSCSVCGATVCMTVGCSLFYFKRFCLPCVRKNIAEFPLEIQQEVKKHQDSG